MLQEVTVTGSRIVRADGYQAPTPVSILGSEDLNKMAVTNVADAVNRLPAFAGSVTTHNVSTNVSSGTAGVNNLNLRGLGANRTLVLLDGRVLHTRHAIHHFAHARRPDQRQLSACDQRRRGREWADRLRGQCRC